jgi:hypothetical protein
MAEAWSAFNDSYLKQLKRPEYWGFTPDQASGSSLLPGSEESNPWAGRDTANSKFGQLGGTAGKILPTAQPNFMSQMQTGMFGNQTGKPQGNSFESLMTAATDKGAKWLGGKAGDWLSGPTSYDQLSPEMEGFAKTLAGEAPVVSGVTEGGLGGYDKLLGGAMADSTAGIADAAGGIGGTAADIAGGGALAAAPLLAKMFGAGKTTSDALGAAGTTGMALVQGGLNPISDVAALFSLYKLFRGLF